MAKPRNHDEYLEQAADFAVPILKRIRAAVHAACPGVVESMKWSSPHFEHEGMLLGVSAHKAHVNLGFWKGTKLSDPEGLLEIIGKTGIGSMRLEQVSDLPPKAVLVKYVKEAMRLNEEAARAPRPSGKKTTKKAAAKRVTVPPDLAAALKKSKKASATFEGFSYSNKKEYVEWLTEAKRDATRAKRLETAIEWMADGKPRNWKYMKEWA